MSRSSDPSVTIIYLCLVWISLSSVKHIPMCRHTLPHTQIPLINSIEMSIGALFVVFCSIDLTLYFQSTVENPQQTTHNTSRSNLQCMCVCVCSTLDIYILTCFPVCLLSAKILRWDWRTRWNHITKGRWAPVTNRQKGVWCALLARWRSEEVNWIQPPFLFDETCVSNLGQIFWQRCTGPLFFFFYSKFLFQLIYSFWFLSDLCTSAYERTHTYSHFDRC